MRDYRSTGIYRRCMLDAAATVAVLGLVLTACNSSPPEAASEALTASHVTTAAGPAPLEPDDPPRRGGKLVVAVSADVNGWNPTINQWTDGGSLMGPSMIEPLMTINSDGEPEPWLAESWDHNENFTEWDLTVRDGIQFHNGQSLDAKAVKTNLDKRFQTGLGRIGLAPLYDHIEVIGPRTVRVHLKTEWAQWPASMQAAYMLAPASYERPDEGTVNPIGTGPFRYVSWQAGDALKVRRWDGYWRKDKAGNQLPYLDEVEFKIGVTEDQRKRDLVSGDADFIITTDPAPASELAKDHTVIRDFGTERTLLILQTDEGADNAPNPFTNLHARRALARATDSQALARFVGEGVQVTTQAYRVGSQWALPPDETGYHVFDPEAARREIEEYKRETGRPSLKFQLKVINEPRFIEVLREAQAQWRKVGIESTIETIDQTAYTVIIVQGKYQAAYYRGYGNTNPDQNYTFHTEANVKPIGELSTNLTHYHSKTLEKNLHTQRENTDFGVRKAANSAIVRELNDQAINIWLYDTPWSIIAQRRVRGLNNFRTHPFGNFTSKPWWGDVWLQ